MAKGARLFGSERKAGAVVAASIIAIVYLSSAVVVSPSIVRASLTPSLSSSPFSSTVSPSPLAAAFAAGSDSDGNGGAKGGHGHSSQSNHQNHGHSHKHKAPEPKKEYHYSITKTASGLISVDSLTSGNFASWTLYGDAVAQNAPHSYFENSQGLHIGIQSNHPGTWTGFYAVSPATSGTLFHAILTLPYASISDNSFNTGLYVQTTTPKINYVTCIASTGPSGHYWSVVLASGNSTSANKFTTLWADSSPNQPLTRDCTIVTNGQNLLKVFLDGVQVYFNDNLSNLAMPKPFNAYLEVETSSASKERFGVYSDYYATTSDMVTVTNVPAHDTVKIIDSNGVVLASSSSSGGTQQNTGIAELAIGKYHLPMKEVTIALYDPDGRVLASDTTAIGSSPISIWGGDTYAIGVTGG